MKLLIDARKAVIMIGVLLGLNIILITVILIMLFNARNDTAKQELLHLASILRSRGLYKHAVEAYRDYLHSGREDNAARARINYLIADIYKDQLNDYEAAMAAYLRVVYFQEDSDIGFLSKKKIIECLERLGRTSEAIADLAMRTDMNAQKGNEVVAQLVDEIITMEDVRRYYQNEPRETVQKLNHPEKRKKLITEFLFYKLMYRKGLRLGYDADARLIRRIDDLKKELIVAELYKREYFERLHITDEEIKDFYNNNRNLFVDKNSGMNRGFAASKDEIVLLLTIKRANQQKNFLFHELVREEGLKLFVNLESTPKKIPVPMVETNAEPAPASNAVTNTEVQTNEEKRTRRRDKDE